MSNHGPKGAPARMPRKKREPYLVVLLKLMPFLETILLGASLYYLGFADGGMVGWLKLFVFGVAAFAVSYGIYRMAIEKGTTLAVSGFRSAGVLSGLSVLLVGASFFMATAPGLTISKVEEMRLAVHVEELSAYVDGRMAVADQAADLAPIMQAMAEDLHAKELEEESTGRGPITRMLESLFTRADGLAAQMTVSLGVRQAVLDQIKTLQDAMEETLADEATNIWERRAILRKQHGRALSLLTELDKAVPVTLVSSYARELDSGVLIPNREDASAKINRSLSGYAETLMGALEDQKGVAGDPPSFPEKSGAMDTFDYMGKFAPIFLITFLVDLAFPLSLWAYSLMAMILHTYRESPDDWDDPNDPNDFDAITGYQGVKPSHVVAKRQNGSGQARRQKSQNPRGSRHRRPPKS